MGSIIGFFADIFGYLLNFIYQFVGNYGLSIIIFSIAIKIIMLPLSIKQQKTFNKTSKIQGQLKEIQKKYENDQTRLAQETMDLYKRENLSPLSGCFSSIVQFLILLSIFFLVKQPLTYMLKMDPQVISQYEEIVKSDQSTNKSNYIEIEIIRKSKTDERINLDIDMNFLGLDLSNVPTQNWNDPTVFIIPGLYVLSSFISMKITTKRNKKKNDDGEEDMTEQLNKQMSIMMPIMSISIAIIAPLGMALYWLVNNILMTVEKIVLNKFIFSKEEEV